MKIVEDIVDISKARKVIASTMGKHDKWRVDLLLTEREDHHLLLTAHQSFFGLIYIGKQFVMLNFVLQPQGRARPVLVKVNSEYQSNTTEIFANRILYRIDSVMRIP